MRLVREEMEAQSRIRRTNTTVQRGSLIQALLHDEDLEKFIYLLAKVEHTGWVDDSDFTFKTGFSKDAKSIWKSCLFDLSDLTAGEFHARIYSDTLAQYWSSGFLELDEMNSNELNTQRAFHAIELVLKNGFRTMNSPDETIIRNSFINYMRSNELIDYSRMIETIIGNYPPVDPNVTAEKIENIKIQLLEQPEKRKFDVLFTPIRSAINAKIKRIYPVNDGIELKIFSNIQDIMQIINAIEEDGLHYIKIRTNNDATYRQFLFNAGRAT